jgi:hypothetical protein
MVIGPTPPGTGVIAPATCRAVERPRRPRGASCPILLGMRHAVDADVDHRRARLDPIARHHLGPPNGGHEDIGAAADLRQIRVREWAMVTVQLLPQQELRHRLAHDVRPPDHHRLHPRQAPVMVAQHHQAAQRRAGHQRLLPRPRQPDIRDVEPVHILFGIDPLITRSAFVQCDRHGNWHRMPCTAGSAFSRSISANTSASDVSAGSLCSKEAMPTSTVCLPLLRT